MSTTTTAYEVLGTTQDVTECQQCGRADLRGTVALAVLEVTALPDGGNEWNHTGEVVYYGSDCGAKAAGYGPGKGRQLRKDAEAADRDAARAEARRLEIAANKAAALVAFNEGRDEDIYLRGARSDYHHMGGYDALGVFPLWLARVAATGCLV